MPEIPENDHGLTEEQIRELADEMFGDSAPRIEPSMGWRRIAVHVAHFHAAAVATNEFSADEAMELTHDLLHIIVSDTLRTLREKREREEGN